MRQIEAILLQLVLNIFGSCCGNLLALLLLDLHLFIHLLGIDRRLAVCGRLRFLVGRSFTNASARIEKVVQLGLAVFRIGIFPCVRAGVLVSLILPTSSIIKKLHLVTHVDENILGSLRVRTSALNGSLSSGPNAGHDTCAARRH